MRLWGLMRLMGIMNNGAHVINGDNINSVEWG